MPGAQSGRLAALERYTPAGAPAAALTFDQMLHRAKVLARTELVPKPLQGKPEAIVLVGVLGAELGVPFMAALDQIHVIEGRPSPSAQLRLALVRRAGHEAEWVETTESVAVIRGRRAERGGTGPWTTVEWTIDQARRAGLTDRWVERWVARDGGRKHPEREVVGDDRGIFNAEQRAHLGLPKVLPEWARQKLDAGEVKCKDNWQRYPVDMLRARAASALCRMLFSDVMTGLGLAPHTAEELGRDVGQDIDSAYAQVDDEPGDITDAEVIEPGGHATAAPTADFEPVEAIEGEAEDAAPASTSDWRSAAADLGVSDSKVLAIARKFAAGCQIEPPTHVDQIDSQPELVTLIEAWLRSLS